MAFEVSEIRRHELKDAMALAKSCGSRLEPPQVILALSLIAREGDQVVGAALCVQEGPGSCRLEFGRVPGGHRGGPEEGAGGRGTA